MTRLINLYALDYWYESDADDPESAYTLIGDEKGDYVIAADGTLTFEEIWDLAETHNEQVKAELQNG